MTYKILGDLITQISYLSSLCGQSNLFTPHNIRGMLHGRHFPFEHPVQHWQSGCHKRLCFSASYFWDSSNPIISYKDPFYSWGVEGLRSFVYLTPELQGWSLSLQDSRKDHFAWLQCRAPFSHLVLPWLAQGPLHEQSPVSFVQSLSLFRTPPEIILLWCHVMERVHDLRVCSGVRILQTPQHLGKPVFPSCWLVGT